MAAGTEEGSATCSVLVVDDEPSILRMLSRVLEELGCTILTAQDAESALEVLGSSQPDLIVSDVRLPGKDGVELTRQAKAITDIPVILISAYREPPDHPGDAFLGKPFDNDELLAKARELLNGRAAERAPA